MKFICDIEAPRGTPISSIKPGETFIYHEGSTHQGVYLRLHDQAIAEYRIMSLETSKVIMTSEDEDVLIVDSTLTYSIRPGQR